MAMQQSAAGGVVTPGDAGLATKPSVSILDSNGSNQATTDSANEPALRAAVNFLVDPRVRRTSQERKIAFLHAKGLSAAQICSAFAQVGETVTPERVAATTASAAAPLTTSVATTAPVATGAVSATPPQPEYSQQQALQSPSLHAPRSPFAAVRSHTLYPAALLSAPAPTPSPGRRSFDWRDVVIAAGAACLAGVAAMHAFMRYSPYELRRKDTPASRVRAQRGSLTRRYVGGSGRRLSGSDTEQSNYHRTSSSLAAATAVSAAAAGGVCGMAANVPPLPATPATAATATSAATVAESEEVKRLQSELADVKEALTNERKRNAELALSTAKARSDQQKVSYLNTKLTHEVDELKAKVAQLEEAAAAAAATATTADGVAGAAESPSAPTDAAHDANTSAQTASVGAIPDDLKALLPQTTPSSTAATTDAPATGASAPAVALAESKAETATSATLAEPTVAPHTASCAAPHDATSDVAAASSVEAQSASKPVSEHATAAAVDVAPAAVVTDAQEATNKKEVCGEVQDADE